MFCAILIARNVFSSLIIAQNAKPVEPNNRIYLIIIFLVNINVLSECGETILIMCAIFVKLSVSHANMPLIIVINVIKLLGMPGKIIHVIVHAQLVLF